MLSQKEQPEIAKKGQDARHAGTWESHASDEDKDLNSSVSPSVTPRGEKSPQDLHAELKQKQRKQANALASSLFDPPDNSPEKRKSNKACAADAQKACVLDTHKAQAPQLKHFCLSAKQTKKLFADSDSDSGEDGYRE